ncbi:MAG: hypothetical protein AB7N76_11485 [Planctomycetota bacterium]
MSLPRIALALVLACAGCKSDEEAKKTDEADKTAKTAAKSGDPKDAKGPLLAVEKEDVEIVMAIDKVATAAGFEILIEADVVGKLTPKEQQALNDTYAAKQDYKGALQDLAKRAKLEAKEEQKGGKTVFRFVKKKE